MTRIIFAACCVAAVLGLGGCKVIKTRPADETAIPADASGDDARTAQRIEATFDRQLLPYITDRALEIADLRTALAGDFKAAGATHGTQGADKTAPWNFPVKGTGKIVAAKLDTRARTASLDTTGDGKADVTVQLGPVIKGSALRDVAPFYNFDDFRDQIEFAKLSRALNDKVSGAVTLPEGDLVGMTLSFVGVVPLKSATETILVTPITVEVTP